MLNQESLPRKKGRDNPFDTPVVKHILFAAQFVIYVLSAVIIVGTWVHF
jgi:hypothetical protein